MGVGLLLLTEDLTKVQKKYDISKWFLKLNHKPINKNFTTIESKNNWDNFINSL